MVFSSLTFLYLFLPFVLVFYYIMPKQLRNLFILITGLFFYAWGEPIYVFIMIASTLIDYFAGLVIYKFGGNKTTRKLALIVSVVMNLSLLGFFKYSNFIVENINNIFGVKVYNSSEKPTNHTAAYRYQLLHLPVHVIHH